MIQIILGVIIVSIGIFVFYKYPMKSDVRQMTLGALFVILAIILKRLAVMVPFLGFPSLKITLEVLTLQPGYCFIVSIATDFLGLVLANAGGFPFLGFTLNAVLQTEIPCLLKIYLNEKNERLLERIVKIVMVIISLLGCLYVFKINEVNISGSSYQVTLPIKFTIFVIIAAMLTILFIFIRYYKNKLKEKDLHLFHLSILSVVAIELTVTMFLTPYWLQTMYGIPFFASQFVRILKSCVMIPVGIIIVYTMNRMIQKVIR